MIQKTNLSEAEHLKLRRDWVEKYIALLLKDGGKRGCPSYSEMFSFIVKKY